MTFRSEVRAPLSDEAMLDILNRAQEAVASLPDDGEGVGEAIERFTGFRPEVLQEAVSGYTMDRFREAVAEGSRGGGVLSAVGAAMGETVACALVFGLVIGRETAPGEHTEVDRDGHTS